MISVAPQRGVERRQMRIESLEQVLTLQPPGRISGRGAGANEALDDMDRVTIGKTAARKGLGMLGPRRVVPACGRPPPRRTACSTAHHRPMASEGSSLLPWNR